MGELEFLRDLVVVFGCATPVVYLFHRLKQSPIVGFLVSGVVVGPYGLSLVHDVASVQTLATVGVMILLFSLGLEFSLQKLMETRVAVLITGPIQMAAITGLVMAVTYSLGVSLRSGFTYGTLVAISSTVVLMKLLAERGEVDSVHGRIGLGISIFQDLATIPLLMAIPLLATGKPLFPGVFLSLLEAVGIILGVVLVARYVFPLLLARVVRTRSKELFLIMAVLMFLGTAWVTSRAGVSLALGSFLAGLILSESEYGHHIFAEVRPVRDALSSLFFVSVGMLVDPSFLVGNLGLVALVTAGVFVGKTLLTAVAVALSRLPLHIGLLTGLSLAQIGEFSFVLLQAGLAVGLVTSASYQLLLASSVITMVLTPIVFGAARKIIAGRLAGAVGRGAELKPAAPGRSPLEDHVVICGFGVAGRNIAHVLKANQIPYIVVDLNGQRVREAEAENEPIVFGDCTSSQLLERVGVRKARVVVLAISDPFASRLVVPTLRAMNPGLVILTRTKYVLDMDELWDQGSTEVIADEFEASLELMTRILRVYNAPRAMVAAQVKAIRGERFGIFRERSTTVPRLRLSSEVDVYTETFVLPPECPLNGATIAGTRLRERTGAWILGIIRGKQTMNNPGPRERLHAGDRLVLSGTKEQLSLAMEMLAECGAIAPDLLSKPLGREQTAAPESSKTASEESELESTKPASE